MDGGVPRGVMTEDVTPDWVVTERNYNFAPHFGNDTEDDNYLLNH